MTAKIGLALGIALLSSTALASGTLMNRAHTRVATSTPFQVTNMVSDQDGVAGTTDPDLVNAWGVAQGGPAGPIWISDNASGKATTYSHSGGKDSITVTIPNGGATGVTFVKPDPNGSIIFPVTADGATGSSVFIFATTNGQIEGWSPAVDPANAIVAVDNSTAGAAYTGIAISNGKQKIFAANFKGNKVEVYDKNFALKTTFTDPNVPQNYAPFNVMVDRGHVYVAFAERGSNGEEVKGAGLGYIDVFRRNGPLLTRLVSNGVLNAPWGMAIAPNTFAEFAGTLLVGNFGDGKINAFNPDTGALVGTLSNSSGAPIVIDGLWGIEARPLGRITFASGPGDEAHGLVGSITPVAR